MSMEDEAEEIEETEESEEQEEEQSGEDTQAVEVEARSMGWVPKDEFRGPEGQWRDAKEFVERGQNVLPIVNSLLKKERAKTSNLEAKIEKVTSDFQDKFERLSQMSTLALEKQREQLEQRFGDVKRRAVETGDTDAYDAADKAEKEALKDLETKAAPKQEPQKQQQNLPSGYPEWIEEVGFDRWTSSMRALASERENELIDSSPAMPVSERLADVLETVKSKFPEKFGKKTSSSNGASKVAGGSRGGGGSAQSAYGRLPKEAKAQAEKDVELYLEEGETAEKDGLKAKERWAKVYWDQPGV